MKEIYRRLSNDDLLAIAKNYDSVVEFQKADFSAYKMATRRGVLADVCAHMAPKNRYYTDEEIREVASRFQTRMDFVNGDLGAYKAAHRRGLLDEVCEHMEYAPSGFSFEKSAFLYQFLVTPPDGSVLYKVGITNRTPKKRLHDMCLLPGVSATLTKAIKYEIGRDARLAEKRLHREFSDYRYAGPAVMKNGNTELFTVQVLDV